MVKNINILACLVLIPLVAIVEGVPLGKMIWPFKKTDPKHGLCPLIHKLEPQDYLKHRAYQTGSRSIDDEPRFTEDAVLSRVHRDVNQENSEDYDLSKELPDSLCGNMCTKDDECGPTKKCCPTTCGYACYEPVTVSKADKL